MIRDGTYQDVREVLDDLEHNVEKMKFEGDVESCEMLINVCLDDIYKIRTILEKERRKE